MTTRDRHDRHEHRVDALGVDGDRQVGSDAGQLDRRVTHRDGLGRHDEKPAARHRHHHVVDQRRYRKRRLELPELLPGRQPKPFRDLCQVRGDRSERLVEREGHVPGLAREDREDGGHLGAENAARKEVQEKRDREGQEAEDRHRLQDVEQRDQHHLGPPALGREGGIGEREDERGPERQKHAQRGAQGVIGQVGVVERDGRSIGRGQRQHHAARAMDDQNEQPEDQRQGDHVPLVGQRAPAEGRESHEL